MTLEAFNVTESVAALPANEDERLLLQRVIAHRKLGRASVELSRAYEQHLQCIAETTELNRLIAERGIDAHHVARMLQLPETFFDIVHGHAPDEPEIA